MENISRWKAGLKISLCAALIGLSQAGYSNERYVICGPDEDGCFEGAYQYCACIPYNEEHSGQAYCMDFDNMTCKPLSEVKDCRRSDTYKNQESCLAMVYQSMERPPCKISTRTFCEEKGMNFCDADGNPDTCHK